ncbi:unnamed protein product, partial [Porites evermanni]
MRLDSSLNVPKEDIEVLPDQTPTFTIKSENQKSTYKACFGDDNSMPFFMGNNISMSQTTNHNIEETECEVEENESLETTVNKITETKKNTALNVKKKALQCREVLTQL